MKRSFNLFYIVGMILASGMMTACNNSNKSAAKADGFARFSWFQYEGKESIYNNIDSVQYKYFNPILAGFYPDPSICRVNDDYYLINSSFSYYPGVPIFHSKDLVNWTQIGNVLDRPSQLNLDSLGVSRGVFAPTIRYNKGKYYMINTIVDGIGNFYVTATNPAGPWSDPILLSGIDGIDPSFFFDDNGKAYVINNGAPEGKPLYNGHRAIWIQEFNVKNGKLTGPRKIIVNGGTDISKKPIWIEGPHIFKKDGMYYLICAQGGTAENHSEVVFRSKKAMGPYVSFPGNPILTQRQLDPNRPNPITCTGHADFVETQNGNWWAVFLGCRPYDKNYYNTGRETFMLPVKWENGWPIILKDDETVPYAVRRPALPLSEKHFPTNGNFTLLDEFNDSTLAYYWNFLRTPREKWYKFEVGDLLIKARNQPIYKVTSQPSFIGRRQQHLHCSASTALSFVTSKTGDKAGLLAFQNEHYYYFLGLVRTENGDAVEVEQGKPDGDGYIVLKSEKLHIRPGNELYLKITADGANYSFYYGTMEGNWLPLLENADGTILSTAKAGGFVGTYFAMYAFAGK